MLPRLSLARSLAIALPSPLAFALPIQPPFNPHSTLCTPLPAGVLGGLLAAYDMSGDKLFLDKAKDLGERLLPAFDTPTGIARGQINLASGSASQAHWAGSSSILAEIGTLQASGRPTQTSTTQPWQRQASRPLLQYGTYHQPHSTRITTAAAAAAAAATTHAPPAASNLPPSMLVP